VGDLTKAVRNQGLKMGLYYSLYEWFNPLWLKDKRQYAVAHMHPQFRDVVNRYSPSILFSDGEWDMPSGDWGSPELLAWLFNESPCREEVVINDRWGKECRHKHGGYWTTEYGAGLPNADHPWEESRGMAYSFGYSRTEVLQDYRTGQELVWMLADLVSRGGNLLIDIGPTADGRIPVIMQDRLIDVGNWLKVNGEAIYGSRAWTTTCQWTSGQQPRQGFGQFRVKYDVTQMVGTRPVDGQARKQAFFTRKPAALYAILPRWPGKTFALKGVKLAPTAKIQMLGVEGTLSYAISDGSVVIQMPELSVDALPCKYAWTLKIAGVEGEKSP
jgi:alpha-L-fucosidase